jgi:hypothetical protein
MRKSLKGTDILGTRQARYAYMLHPENFANFGRLGVFNKFIDPWWTYSVSMK